MRSARSRSSTTSPVRAITSPKRPQARPRRRPAKEADAKYLPVTISGHNVYGEHNPAGVGYRNNAAKGIPTGDNAQTVYAIVDGNYYKRWLLLRLWQRRNQQR